MANRSPPGNVEQATDHGATSAASATDRTDAADARRRAGGVIAAGAAVFFLGSAVLTRSGDPGASTPLPWLASHVLWAVAAAVVAAGTVLVVRHTPGLRQGLAGHLAGGAFGLGALHAFQWSAWVYADVAARRTGEHDLLLESLLHPFGTAHALVYGVLVGGGVALLGWGLVRARATRRLVDWAGVTAGATTAVVATGALTAVADVDQPSVLAVVGLLAVAHGWLLVVGAALYRGG